MKICTKFNEGDWVIGNDKADEKYAVTRKGVIGQVMSNDLWCVFNEMINIEVKIKGKLKKYTVDPDCFDLYIPREGKILIIVDEKDPNKIIARDLITKKTAEAKCNPKDEWDFAKGAKLALERLYPEKAKEKKEDEPKYWSGKMVCVWNDGEDYFFTVGKVYTVVNGVLYDNYPNPPYMNGIKSIEHLNKVAKGWYKFIEYKGEAPHA